MQKIKEYEELQYYQLKQCSSTQKMKKFKKKRFWTKRQDQILQQGVKKYGSKKWSKISKLLKKRNPKRCRQRWFNYLKQQSKIWDQNQLWILYLCHRVYGRKWADISKILNRGDNVIKNKVNCFKDDQKLQFQQKINNLKKNFFQLDKLSNVQKKLIQEILNAEKVFQKPIKEKESEERIQKKQNSIISNQACILQKHSYNQYNWVILTPDYLSMIPYQPIYSQFYPYLPYWQCI